MKFDRRAFTKLAATGIVTGVAGCGGGDGGSGIDESQLEGRTLTAIVTFSAPSAQLNPYSLSVSGMSIRDMLDQLVYPAVGPTGEPLASGHQWTVDGTDVEVPCVVEGVEIDAPDGYTLSFNDELTYWNGESIDARAYYLFDRINYFAFGNPNERAFPGELVSETEYAWSYANGKNRHQIQHDVFPGRPPLPPSFTEPWVTQFEDASTEDETNDVFQDLSLSEVSLVTMVEEGYGSGAYEIESTEDLPGNALLARARDDHPGDIAVPNLVLRFIGQEGLGRSFAGRAAITSGEIDVGRAIIADNGGDVGPQALPDHIQQIGTYQSPRSFGFQLLFNWEREHIRRLWVRRALLAAAPFERAIDTAWGEGMVRPNYDAGLLSAVDEATLPGDLLDALYAYPIARDDETAQMWLERAGYQREEGQWYDSSGSPLQIRLLQLSGATGQNRVASVLATGFTEFGIPSETTSARARDFETTVGEGDFEIAFGGVPSDWSALEQYTPAMGVGSSGAGGSPLSILGNPLETCDDASGDFSFPASVTIPNDPGSLTIEGVPYEDGGSTYQHDGGTDVSICETIDRLTTADTDEATIQAGLETCARWYNYAVPNFLLVQPRTGMYGNTRDYTFPARDRTAITATRNWTTNPAHYHIQAGTIR